MDIDYALKSEFILPCEAAIREAREELAAGGTIHVHLAEKGYNGLVHVTVRSNDGVAFSTDWDRSDPTRFPARIKAAATALRNCYHEGRFEVSHLDGLLTIRMA